MTRFELVIVGGGLAAARAIDEYRAAGGEGRIALLAMEEALPYHRPPPSKRFLREQRAGRRGPRRPRRRGSARGLVSRGQRGGGRRRRARRRALRDERSRRYAAADVARFFDAVFGRQRRIEHWSNADYQGRQAGRVLAGADRGYDTVSSFFTESFGLTLKVFGDVSEHDDRIARGSFADGDAIVFYLERGQLVGTLHTGQDDATEEALKGLIRDGAEARELRLLADDTVPVDEACAAETTAVGL